MTEKNKNLKHIFAFLKGIIWIHMLIYIISYGEIMNFFVIMIGI